MVTIKNLRFSNHLRDERNERLKNIYAIGLGQIVKEQWYTRCYHCLTDTGVMLVVDKDGTYCMTMYFADYKEVNRMYAGRVPKYIQSKIDKNMAAGLVERRKQYELR